MHPSRIMRSTSSRVLAALDAQLSVGRENSNHHSLPPSTTPNSSLAALDVDPSRIGSTSTLRAPSWTRVAPVDAPPPPSFSQRMRRSATTPPYTVDKRVMVAVTKPRSIIPKGAIKNSSPNGAPPSTTEASSLNTTKASSVEAVLPTTTPLVMIKAANQIDAAIKQASLPIYSYKDCEWASEPAVVYTNNEEEANELIGALQGPLGFDMEWPVIFRKGAKAIDKRTALVQLSDTRIILLIHVSKMSCFPYRLQEVIEDPEIVKTGANIKNDADKLFRDFGILARGLVELGALAHVADPWTGISSAPVSDSAVSGTTSDSATSMTTAKNDKVTLTLRPHYAPEGGFPFSRAIVSLARMVCTYTQRHLLKDSVRTSNWEAALSSSQQEYAANDAHCAVVVYNRLMALARLVPGREIETAKVRIDMDTEYWTRVRKEVATTNTASASAAADPAGNSAPSHTDIAATATEAQNTMPPRHKQAYVLWHQRGYNLERVCEEMRGGKPLAASTVISYVIGALKADPALPFDRTRLWKLVQGEIGQWRWHGEWLQSMDRRSAVAPK